MMDTKEKRAKPVDCTACGSNALDCAGHIGLAPHIYQEAKVLQATDPRIAKSHPGGR